MIEIGSFISTIVNGDCILIIRIFSSERFREHNLFSVFSKIWILKFDMLSVIWKSDLTDKMKRSFFRAAVVSILLYGCITWTLTKRLEKKLDGNYTRMLRAILNKSWRQYPTKHQLYGHLPPIMKIIEVRRTRPAEHRWRSRDELISDVLLWTPTYGRAKAGRPARTYIQQLCEDTDVVQKTSRRRWTIGKSGERGSGISVGAAWHDHDHVYWKKKKKTFQRENIIEKKGRKYYMAIGFDVRNNYKLTILVISYI